MNVKDLRYALFQMDDELEVFFRNVPPITSTITEVVTVNEDTYGFFGKSIPCVILETYQGDLAMRDNVYLTHLLPANQQDKENPGEVLVRNNTHNFHVNGILYPPVGNDGVWRVGGAGTGCGCLFHQDDVNDPRSSGMTAIITIG